MLLGLAGSAAPAAPPSTVLDIRRYDERTLYGSIPGTKHIPGARTANLCWACLEDFAMRCLACFQQDAEGCDTNGGLPCFLCLFLICNIERRLLRISYRC